MDEVVELRKLVAGDEQLLFAFLGRYVESSLFFFSNVERVGFDDQGERFQGTYVASLDGSGAITAVACHSWSGTLMLQGDRGLEQAAQRAVELTGRKVGGFIGPWSLVCRARKAFRLEQTRAGHDGAELLFALSLDARALVANGRRAACADQRRSGWGARNSGLRLVHRANQPGGAARVHGSWLPGHRRFWLGLVLEALRFYGSLDCAQTVCPGGALGSAMSTQSSGLMGLELMAWHSAGSSQSTKQRRVSPNGPVQALPAGQSALVVQRWEQMGFSPVPGM